MQRRLLEAFFSRIKQNDVVFSTKLKLLKYEAFSQEGVSIAPSQENDVLTNLKLEQLELVYATLAELGIPRERVRGFEGKTLQEKGQRSQRTPERVKKALQTQGENSLPPQKNLAEALKIFQSQPGAKASPQSGPVDRQRRRDTSSPRRVPKAATPPLAAAKQATPQPPSAKAKLPVHKPQQEDLTQPTSLSDIEQRQKDKQFEEKKTEVMQRQYVKDLLPFLSTFDFQEIDKKV